MWQVNITVRDEKGGRSKVQLYLPYSDLTTIADAAQSPVEFAQQFATYLNAVITGAIESISLSLRVELPAGLTAAPGANSDIEEGATFIYRTAGGFVTRQRIPTFSEGFVVPGTREIDLVPTAVANLVEMMTIPSDLPGNWGIGPSDSRGDGIIALSEAREQFRSYD